MKKIFFSMLVVLFAACGGAKDITVDKLSFEKKSDAFSYNITVPQIKDSGNKNVEELNEELASDAKALIASIEKGEEDTPEFYDCLLYTSSTALCRLQWDHKQQEQEL